MPSEYVRPAARRRLTGSPPAWPPRGTWVGASRALQREVPLAEPYPHICHMPYRGWDATAADLTVLRRDCAACAADAREVVTR